MLKTSYLVGFSFLLIATDVALCNPEYLYYYEAEGWLKLHRTPATWEQAYVRCHDEGAVLASPLTKGLLNTLITIDNQNDVYGNIFVGTHALFSKGDYVSVEGVPLSAMEVSVGTYGEGDCMSLSNARIYYSNCTEPLPFICYKKIESRPLNECGTFDDKYQLNQKTGSCYKVHQEVLPWHRAYRVCASEGGYLVIVNDEEEAAIIKDLFPPRINDTDPDTFYVGLASWGNDHVWMSIKGDAITDIYNKWDGAEPKSFASRAALNSNGLLEVVFIRHSKFVCEKSPKENMFEGTPPCGENLMKLCKVCEATPVKPASDLNLLLSPH